MGQLANKMGISQKKLLIDIGLFTLFIIVSAPQVTGIAVHEWLSLVIVAPLVIHLLVNWQWMVNVIKRAFKKMPGETRFNQIWDALLFVVMTMVIASGILISESVLPTLGVTLNIDRYWVSLHDITSNLFLIMLGVHLAMHWTWLVNTFKRYVHRRPVQVTAVQEGN